MTTEEKELRKLEMLELMPKDGKSIGNVNLLKIFKSKTKLSDDFYWLIRNELIKEGLLGNGRGRGGSVFKIKAEPVESNNNNPHKRPKIKEKDLYYPFYKFLENSWTKLNVLENCIIEITANQGSKDTGGKWTRPDLTIIDLKSYTFYPSKILEVITFEIKPFMSYGIESVFEAAAHTLFAHRSYLAIQYLKDDLESDEFIEVIRKRCEMFGIGLILFKNLDDWESVVVISESKYNNPDPSEVNQFILRQISQKNQNLLSSKMR